MSQHPRSVPSGSGLAVREGFNNALDSAFTLNSGSIAPASPQAGLLWLDTATGVLKIRNDANTNWVSLLDRLGGAESGQVVRHDVAQSLTSGQQQQARENIGMGSVATENIVPVTKGGTGATTEAGARSGIQAPWAPIGSRVGASHGTGSFSVPAGGTWFFWRLVTGPGGNVIADTGVGVVAGGTLVASTGSNAYNVWYWRVA